MGSVIARGCLHSGLPPKRMLENLFHSSRSYFSFLMPSSFQRLGTLTGKSSAEILDEHTVFPYSVAFMTIEERMRLRKKALEINVQSDCLGSLTKSVTFGVPFRRVCPQCITEDLEVFGETYWHRSHLLPAVHICIKHGSRLRETDLPLKRNANRSFTIFPADVCLKPVITVAPCFILEAVAELSLATLTLTWNKEIDWQRGYRAKSLERGYRIERGAVASKALCADIAKFYGDKFLEDCGAQFNAHAAGSWPSLMPRERSGIPFAPVKHVLMQTFLSIENSQAMNVAVNYAKPGRLADDCCELDVQAVKAIHRTLDRAKRSGVRFTVQELMRSAGVWEKFRHQREKFPGTNALIQAFRLTDQSERQIGKRNRLYKKASAQG